MPIALGLGNALPLAGEPAPPCLTPPTWNPLGGPTNATVISGNTFGFQAFATGCGIIVGQWERRLATDPPGVFTPIPGATGNLYLGIATPALNQSQYRRVFTNSAGSTASAIATLTVP